MNNHNTTATSLPNAANKVIVNMTGSSSPAQINMISSSLQKPVFQAAPTTTKPTNPTLIPINITVPASTPITLVPTNQVTSRQVETLLFSCLSKWHQETASPAARYKKNNRIGNQN